jgi:hypothetical protein
MNTLKLRFAGLLAAALLTTFGAFAQKEKTVMVGGAEMYPSKNIIPKIIQHW